MAEKIRQKAVKEGKILNDNEVLAKVKALIDNLRLKMPFYLTIERDEDNKENLTISSIRDRDDNDIADNNIEINIQSLGTDDGYWLDSGEFEIQ